MTPPMSLDRINELRERVEAADMYWSDVAELESAFAEIDPVVYAERGAPEDAMWSDQLDELEAAWHRAPDVFRP